MRKHLMTISLLLPWAVEAAPELSDAARDAFVAEAVSTHSLEASEVEAWLNTARYQQSIIDAITRPAEGKPWSAYRPIFLNAARIDGGKAFLRENWAALSEVEQRTGVPAELIVSIMGVETNYGRITGSYRVLDALYTLGLFYPPREAFFRSELATLFRLAHDESIDLSRVKGSYAGAMGWGQFMPSSYRAYAVDGDGDGHRDLWNSKPDIFASIANYFVAHGWRAGEPVALAARKDATQEEFVAGSLEAKFGLAELGAKGYRPTQAVGHDVPATVLNLDGERGREYWITFHNFYVISRYNRSPLYSLAVFQLSQQIAQARPAASRAANP